MVLLPALILAISIVNSGTSVVSETSSSASSGGQTSSGGSVTTGSASASSESSVTIGSGDKGDGGNTVSVQVSTEVNGQKTHETKNVDVPVGGVSVSVVATSSAKGTESLATSSIRVEKATGAIGGTPTSTLDIEGVATTSTRTFSVSVIAQNIASFFSRIFGFLWLR